MAKRIWRDFDKVLIGSPEFRLGSYDLIFFDPPYGGIVPASWDRRVCLADYVRWAQKLSSLLRPGGCLWWCGGVGKPGRRLFYQILLEIEADSSSDLDVVDIFTWVKRRGYGVRNRYLFAREEMMWLEKRGGPRTFNVPYLDKLRGYEGYNPKYPALSPYLRRTTVWSDIPEILKGKRHECEKPYRLVETVVRTHSVPGDRVLDPMAGCGVTGEVCDDLDRHSVLVEVDTQYRGIARRPAPERKEPT